MRRIVPFFLSTLFIIQGAPAQENESPVENPSVQTPQSPAEPFKPFTGKITRNNVRLRVQPNLDCLILKELNHHDKVVVLGETGDFYAVQPLPDCKGYVFRTYVLDGAVEGKHVNVRLEPNTEAPIIAQLNTGDRVEGHVSSLNNKWLEITPPENTRFYVCKEYVENIGDPTLMSLLIKRGDEVDALLLNAKELAGTELQKPFEEIRIDPAVNSLTLIIKEYSDFPDQVAEAREQLGEVQDLYLQKKLAYLEHKANDLSQKLASAHQQAPQPPIAQEASPLIPVLIDTPTTTPRSLEDKTARWIPVEDRFYHEWLKTNPGRTMDDFYLDQEKQAVNLKGILEPYSRSIRNKPGDYILISKATHLPTAYLYSTKVDLGAYTGNEITLRAVPRPNNNFAFPAYFVLTVE